MKVITFVDKFPAYSETYPLWHMIEMIKKGDDISIFSRIKGGNTDRHKEHECTEEKTHILHYGEPTPILGRKIIFSYLCYIFFHPLRTLKVYRVSKTKSMFINILSWKIKVKRKVSADVAHAYFGNNGIFASNLINLNFLECPLVVSFLGFDLNVLPGIYGKDMYHDLFETASALTVSSRFMEKKLRALGAPDNKIILLPLGLPVENLPMKCIPFSRGSIKAISVGRLEPVKGMIWAVESIAELRKSGVDISLDIYGSGSDFGYLQSRISQLNIGGRIKLHGSQPHRTIVGAMLESDLLLYTGVRDKEGAEEALGGVVLEAQSVGLPVVATRVGGVVEGFRDTVTGISVEPASLKSICDGVVAAISLIENSPDLSSKCREYIKSRFDSYALESQWRDLYGKVIKDQVRKVIT